MHNTDKSKVNSSEPHHRHCPSLLFDGSIRYCVRSDKNFNCISSSSSPSSSSSCLRCSSMLQRYGDICRVIVTCFRCCCGYPATGAAVAAAASGYCCSWGACLSAVYGEETWVHA